MSIFQCFVLNCIYECMFSSHNSKYFFICFLFYSTYSFHTPPTPHLKDFYTSSQGRMDHSTTKTGYPRRNRSHRKQPDRPTVIRRQLLMCRCFTKYTIHCKFGYLERETTIRSTTRSQYIDAQKRPILS